MNAAHDDPHGPDTVPAPAPTEPVTVLDSKGRRFVALTQAEAERMRDEWLRSEGYKHAAAQFAAEVAHMAAPAPRPPVWVRAWRWFMGGSQA